MKTKLRNGVLCGWVAGLCCLMLAACGKKGGGATETAGGTAGAPIQIQGSDTMVNLAQAWAETYSGMESGANIEVGGGE